MVPDRLWKVHILPVTALHVCYELQRTTSPPSERSVVSVISPLVSLMIDQVSSLQQRGQRFATSFSGVQLQYCYVCCSW